MDRVASASTTQDIRRDNRRRILELLRESEPVGRIELARIAGLTEPAVSRITRELVDAGLVQEVAGSGASSRPGRPAVALRLCDDGAYVVGMNLSADKQWACVANSRGDVLAKREFALDDITDPESVIAYAAQEVFQLIKTIRIKRSRLLGAGITVAGTVDPVTGVLVQSPNLGWPQIPLKGMLEAALKLAVRVEGRSPAMLTAEKRIGVAWSMTNAALIMPGLGIGGSILIDGRLARGRLNRAGQIGHMRADHSKLRCWCGKTGCLDTVASGRAILRNLKLISNRTYMPRHQVEHALLFEQAVARDAAADPQAQRVFREAGQALGTALGALAAVVDPEAIFLAGPVGHADSYLAGARQAMAEYSDVPIEPSTVPNDMAAIWLALETFFYSRDLDFARLMPHAAGA